MDTFCLPDDPCPLSLPNSWWPHYSSSSVQELVWWKRTIPPPVWWSVLNAWCLMHEWRWRQRQIQWLLRSFAWGAVLWQAYEYSWIILKTSCFKPRWSLPSTALCTTPPQGLRSRVPNWTLLEENLVQLPTHMTLPVRLNGNKRRIKTLTKWIS